LFRFVRVLYDPPVFLDDDTSVWYIQSG
jgi:hypothetical protein